MRNITWHRAILTRADALTIFAAAMFHQSSSGWSSRWGHCAIDTRNAVGSVCLLSCFHPQLRSSSKDKSPERLHRLYRKAWIERCVIGSRRTSPRSVSIPRLHTLLYFHLEPINGSSSRDLTGLLAMRTLILRWASHLDAFSGYPLRTWLPSVYRWHDNWYTSGASFPVLSY